MGWEISPRQGITSSRDRFNALPLDDHLVVSLIGIVHGRDLYGTPLRWFQTSSILGIGEERLYRVGDGERSDAV
jgi:hypothetical protein